MFASIAPSLPVSANQSHSKPNQHRGETRRTVADRQPLAMFTHSPRFSSQKRIGCRAMTLNVCKGSKPHAALGPPQNVTVGSINPASAARPTSQLAQKTNPSASSATPGPADRFLPLQRETQGPARRPRWLSDTMPPEMGAGATGGRRPAKHRQEPIRKYTGGRAAAPDQTCGGLLRPAHGGGVRKKCPVWSPCGPDLSRPDHRSRPRVGGEPTAARSVAHSNTAQILLFYWVGYVIGCWAEGCTGCWPPRIRGRTIPSCNHQSR